MSKSEKDTDPSASLTRMTDGNLVNGTLRDGRPVCSMCSKRYLPWKCQGCGDLEGLQSKGCAQCVWREDKVAHQLKRNMICFACDRDGKPLTHAEVDYLTSRGIWPPDVDKVIHQTLRQGITLYPLGTLILAVGSSGIQTVVALQPICREIVVTSRDVGGWLHFVLPEWLRRIRHCVEDKERVQAVARYRGVRGRL